jgi:hypothetical protein
MGLEGVTEALLRFLEFLRLMLVVVAAEVLVRQLVALVVLAVVAMEERPPLAQAQTEQTVLLIREAVVAVLNHQRQLLTIAQQVVLADLE